MCGLYLVWGGMWWYLCVVGMVSSRVSWPRVVVCMVRMVVSRSAFCPVGVPCVGYLVRRYAPWCKIS